MKRRLNNLIVALIAVFAVCITIALYCSVSSTKNAGDMVLDSLYRSRSFQALYSRVQRPIAMVDHEGPTFVEFQIGEDLPDHFSRADTLRVDKETGKVSKLCENENLEQIWVDE